ncbi:MAG: RusA family crossover junction endodeoxyribonuclease [Spirochaetaceae bacterium]|nr:RusA family crossover junction endodeoxyribonuclease [Spirochaetaceae bacterium]
MTLLYDVFVIGKPKAQPRPKAARIGNYIRIYTPDTAKEWRQRIKNTFLCVRRSSQITEPCKADIDFYFKGKGQGFFSKRPDVDNLAKAVFDALTEIGIWKDDSLICDSRLKKYSGKQEGAAIRIYSLA